jgi:hypothetical protein
MQAETVDLDSHNSSVGLVKVEQYKNVLVPCIVNVSLDQRLGNLRIAFVIDVHGEKGQIGCDIPIPETVIEFDAIDNLDPVDIIDVSSSKISVAITNLSPLYTILKEVSLSSQEGPRCCPYDTVNSF